MQVAAKSIAELKTSKSITGAELQSNFKVLDSKNSAVSRRSSTETSKEGVFMELKNLHKNKNVFSRVREVCCRSEDVMYCHHGKVQDRTQGC